MGGRRLPFAETLIARLALLAACAFAAAACFGGDDDENPTPTGVPQTATAAATPSPSPTPDPVSTPPVSQLDARRWLQAALGPSFFDPPCPERLTNVGVACAAGDGDGDGVPDLAYLVPVKIAGTQLPKPSAVFLRVGNSQKLAEFAIDLTADSSIFGIAFFTFEDRTGDGLADLSYLENVCGGTGCRTRPVVKSWDGTTWRDTGPADDGVDNIDLVQWEGEGAASKLTVHGGKLPLSALAGAGPSRAATTTYVLDSRRFVRDAFEPDAAEYLYHAFLDADAVFETDKQAALPLFEDVASDRALLDWKSPTTQGDRRAALRGFALFRIALAHAALQRDAQTLNVALDRVILESGERLFVNVAQEFRRGFNERGGLIGGCAEVHLYLSRPVEGADTKGYVEQLFNYGYANPPGTTWLEKICPF